MLNFIKEYLSSTKQPALQELVDINNQKRAISLSRAETQATANSSTAKAGRVK